MKPHLQVTLFMWGVNAGAFSFTLGWAFGGGHLNPVILILQTLCLVMGFIGATERIMRRHRTHS